MRELNLTANDRGQELILTYLQENASEILADKINNGVYITKDNKVLINKKTLDTFMKYAHEEARKLAEKGATYACVDDNEVYGWAIHYFEEDTLEGVLYNEDGTEYKPTPKATQKTKTNAKSITTTTVKELPKKEIEQLSLFDLVEQQILKDTTSEAKENAYKEDTTIAETVIPETVIEPIIEVETPLTPKPTISPEYKRFEEFSTKYPDCIIAIRKGDFYEIMGSQAVLLDNELNMTLTSRDYGLPERIPIIGIPYHAMDAYAAMICKTHKLAISIAEDHIQVIPILKPLEDEYEDIETEPDDDLTYEEMREFDGDIEEECDTPTVTTVSYTQSNNSFNPTALQLAKQLLGDTFILR